MTEIIPVRTAKRPQKRARAHALVLKVAKEMAHEVYEECASLSDDWYKQWPDKRAYVRVATPYLFEEARRTLAKMLTDKNMAENQKEEIAEALIVDAQFIRQKGAEGKVGQMIEGTLQ